MKQTIDQAHERTKVLGLVMALAHGGLLGAGKTKSKRGTPQTLFARRLDSWAADPPRHRASPL